MTETHCLHCRRRIPPFMKRRIGSWCSFSCRAAGDAAAQRRRDDMMRLIKFMNNQRKRVTKRMRQPVKRYQPKELSDTDIVTVRGRM